MMRMALQRGGRVNNHLYGNCRAAVLMTMIGEDYRA